MTNELKQQTRWAQQHVGRWWVLALSTPVKPELLGWLVETYEVEKTQALTSGAMALLVQTTPATVSLLMELPKPKGKGSRHEVNELSW